MSDGRSEVRSDAGRPGPWLSARVVVVITGLLLSSMASASAADAQEPTPAPCADLPRVFFDDVADASVAAASIDCLFWHGIVDGITSDRFGVDADVRRDQFASLLDATIATAGVQLEDPPEVPFDDVQGVHAAAIARLEGGDILQGRSARRFAPAEPVRRDQLATMVVHTYDVISGTASEPAAHGFDDLEGNVHEATIGRAVELGVVSGVTPTAYVPARSATRAQATIMLAQLLQRLSADGLLGVSILSAGYDARIGALPSSLEQEVRRWTWREGCPVAPSELSLVELVHTDFDGIDRWGRLVVHADQAEDVARAFGELHGEGFAIERMEPVERFEGDDHASMAANNTSAFNCRSVSGGTGFSQHSYGWAIDINPVQNPYVRNGEVAPAAGRDYRDRDDVRPGMLVRPGAVTVFDNLGWGWGGDWNTLKDYQHVSLTGG